jgi:energy-coupling factor transporter transmembrane protein EcfT
MVKSNKQYKIIDINTYNIKITKENNRYLLGLIILLLLILLFIKNFNDIKTRILVFIIIFTLTIVISKNLVISIIISLIIFLLINLLISYKYTLENFKSESDEKSINFKEIASNEPLFDKNIFSTDEFKKSTDGIQDLLKKVNGGIELKDDDLKETDKLGIDTDKYSDDKKPNALKQAQKEAYQLIDTVNALKDTVNTLAPVLSEGKKLMDIFQNLKI